MPRLDYKTCKGCGRSVLECGTLSHTRLCGDCGNTRLVASIVQQSNHSGPVFQHWRTRIAASVGAIILDDTRASA